MQMFCSGTQLHMRLKVYLCLASLMAVTDSCDDPKSQSMRSCQVSDIKHGAQLLLLYINIALRIRAPRSQYKHLAKNVTFLTEWSLISVCESKGHSFLPEVIQRIHCDITHRWCKCAKSQFQWEGCSFGTEKGALFASLPLLCYMTRTLFVCYSIRSFEGKLSCPLWIWPNSHIWERRKYIVSRGPRTEIL